MALIDEIENLGRRVDAGELSVEEAAHQLQQASGGGLTRLGATRLLADWKNARARYEQVFDEAAGAAPKP